MTYEPNTPAGRAMRRILEWLLFELDRGWHEVVLIPAPEPTHSTHSVRVVQSHNCNWYREFNQQFVSIRGRGRKRYQRARTFIRKDRTRSTIVRMIAGDFRGVQAARLVEYIERKRSNRRHKRQAAREFAGDDWGGIPF